MVKENIEKDDYNSKYKTKYTIPTNLLKLFHKELYDLYSKSSITTIIKPKTLHNLITNFFYKRILSIYIKKFQYE